MKSYRLCLLLIVVVAGWAVAPLRAEIAKETAPLFTRIGRAVAVPAELRNHMLFVNVMVNGQGPFRVFVDTGCSFTLFSPELAAAVKALPAPDDEATVRLRAPFDEASLGQRHFAATASCGICGKATNAAPVSPMSARQIAFQVALAVTGLPEIFIGETIADPVEPGHRQPGQRPLR